MSRLLVIALLILATVLLMATPAAAIADRYVDIRNGSDANNGQTLNQAWKTIHYALTQANIAGNVNLHVMEGVYSVANGEPATAIQGLTASNIAVQGPPDDSAVLDGTAGGAWVRGLDLQASGIYVMNLTIRNFTGAGVSINTNLALAAVIKVQKCKIQNNLNGVEISNQNVAYPLNPEIINCLFTGQTDYNVHSYNPGGLQPINAKVYHNTMIGGRKGVYTNQQSANGDISFNIMYNYSEYGIYAGTNSTPTYSYNDLNSTVAGAIAVGGTAIDNGGNITMAPTFGTGYRPSSTSPTNDTIPSGANTVSEDLDNRVRPVGVNKDMGAFEYRTPLTANVVVTAGSTVADYQIKSMPMEVDDDRLTAVFGPYIDPYDTTQNRLGRWDPRLGVYSEYPGDTDARARPGYAAWFLSRGGLNLTFTGRKALTAPQPISTQPANAVPLLQDWNQVGNPFNFPIQIADFEVKNEVTGVSETFTTGTITQGIFWVWVGGTYVAVAKLPIGGGGWVKLNPAVGSIFFRDAAVAYPDPGLSGTVAAEVVIPVSDTVERPPDPPAMSGSSSGFSSGGGGGGGGGCFIEGLR